MSNDIIQYSGELKAKVKVALMLDNYASYISDIVVYRLITIDSDSVFIRSGFSKFFKEIKNKENKIDCFCLV